MRRLAMLSLLAAGCVPGFVRDQVDARVAPSVDRPWVAPDGAKGSAVPSPPAIEAGHVYALPDLLAFGLAHNPSTRQAYENARAAAAQLGSKQSLYWPAINATAQLGYTQQSIGGGKTVIEQASGSPALGLNWLVFDLGTRAGDIGEARELLFAANFAQDQNLQDEILKIEQAYYGELAAKGLVAAQEATVDEDKANLEAANARHEQGVGTIADVLQAKTALSQAQLSLQGARGQLATQAGALANALGLPAMRPVEIGELPQLPAANPLQESVDALVQRAWEQRPDLARARAQALAAGEHVGSVRGKGLPSLNATAAAGRSFFINGSTPYGDNLAAAIVVSIPIFDGFRDSNDLAQAEAQERAAQAQQESVAEQVALQVWDSYQSVQTASQQLATAKDLLESASESEKVASGRYHDGVGTILDLLTAQAALANARAQEVQARANWLVSLATLAHDTGNMTPPDQGQGMTK
jgi:outer membrane protein